MYRRRSRIRPIGLIGLTSDSLSASSRKVMGNPTLIVKSIFPARSDPKGNWNAAIIKTSMKIPPNIVPILFVGISCLGIALPMAWLNVSLPAYL